MIYEGCPMYTKEQQKKLVEIITGKIIKSLQNERRETEEKKMQYRKVQNVSHMLSRK